VDAITVAAEVITGLQQVVSRMVDPIQPAVVTLGIIKGGTARNIIADTVEVEGTARSLDPDLSRKLPRLIEKTAVGIGKAYGAKVVVRTIADYPALFSDSKVNAFIADAYKAIYSKGKVHQFPIVMGGEDFAYYVQKTPGAMFRLGVANKKIGADKPWHHPAFKIDEAAIPTGYITIAAAVAKIMFASKGNR
jgi:amidohydrolase